eukprot:jgi/Mesvir1/13118/Mv06094-RA.1
MGNLLGSTRGGQSRLSWWRILARHLRLRSSSGAESPTLQAEASAVPAQGAVPATEAIVVENNADIPMEHAEAPMGEVENTTAAASVQARAGRVVQAECAMCGWVLPLRVPDDLKVIRADGGTHVALVQAGGGSAPVRCDDPPLAGSTLARDATQADGLFLRRFYCPIGHKVGTVVMNPASDHDTHTGASADVTLPSRSGAMLDQRKVLVVELVEGKPEKVVSLFEWARGRRLIVCGYFPRGRCNKGEDCKYAHVASSRASYFPPPAADAARGSWGRTDGKG